MTVASILLVASRLILAVVFGVSVTAKITDRGGFKAALGNFGVPGALQALAAVLIPLLELFTAIGLLPGVSAWAAAISALSLLVVFTVAIVVNLLRGKRPECHCFGQLSSTPVGWGSVVRNVLLLAAALVVVVGGRVNSGPSMLGWAARLSLPELLGLAAGVVITGVVGIETWVLAHVLRQNGRLLLRLDGLEASLARAGFQGAPVALPAASGPHAGLPVGAPAPVFRLDRLGGGSVTTAELLASGKQVALAFVDPDCGPCSALLPELARWQHELADQVTVAVITTKSAEANARKLRGHSLGDVLLQKDREVSEAYRAHATPSMVLVEPSGMIGSPVAPGRDAIRALMARIVTGHRQGDVVGLWEPSARSDGNSAQGGGELRMSSQTGQFSPDLRLLDLDGRPVSLAAFRGAPTLVLFWNPACGFCQQMLGDLKDWLEARSDTSPQLVVISAGTAEANRAMKLQAPIMLDAGFASGRAFGANGTPSAVLIDEDGHIASELAAGAQAVLALARIPVAARAAGE